MSHDPSPLSPDIGTHRRPSAYLTADLPGIGGVIKQRPEDFLVEEIPLYDPCGFGEHIYLFVEKREISTFEMIAVLATHFGVRRHAVGYAGLKDKHAITRQVVSIHAPGKKIEDFPMLTHDRLGVLWADYHANKLRTGHLRGNRFSVRIRGTSLAGVRSAERVLDRLAQTGVPNRFGEQRFGRRGNNHLIGRAVIAEQFEDAARMLLGPSPGGSEDESPAIQAFCRGDFKEALIRTPRHARAEDRALRALINGRSAREAIRSIDRATLGFYFSAFQSAIFNAVLDERLRNGTLGTLSLGDVAMKHENRAMFAVDQGVIDDPATEARLNSFEISPTGPMWGAGMMPASGATAARELDALQHFGITVENLDRAARQPGHQPEGARRPLRVPLVDPIVEGGADEHGLYVRCAFELPRGAFATVVMGEIIKPKSPRTFGAASDNDNDSE